MAAGYQNLIVWQKAMDLVVIVYKITSHFPKSEVYGLSSQMRRAAVSIPSNIAEGSKRRTKADFRNFLAIALGSAAELETQFIIAQRLTFADATIIVRGEEILSEISRILSTLVLRTHDL